MKKFERKKERNLSCKEKLRRKFLICSSDFELRDFPFFETIGKEKEKERKKKNHVKLVCLV